MKELYDKLVAAGDYVGDFNQFKKDYGGDEYENLYIKIADNGDYVGSFDDFKNDYEPVKITPIETDTAVEEVESVSDTPSESSDTKSQSKDLENSKPKLGGINIDNIVELREKWRKNEEEEKQDKKTDLGLVEETFGVLKDATLNVATGMVKDFIGGASRGFDMAKFNAMNIYKPNRTTEEKTALFNAIANGNEGTGYTLGDVAGMSSSAINLGTKLLSSFGVLDDGSISTEDILKTGEYFEGGMSEINNESVTKALSKGDFGDAAKLTINGMARSMPSIIAAYGGTGAIAVFGSTVTGNKFAEEFQKNPDESLKTLTANAVGNGVIEAGFEMVSRGILKKAGIISSGKTNGKKLAREYMKKSSESFVKKLGWTMPGEGLSEAATEVTSMLWDNFDAIGVGVEGEETDFFDKDGNFQMGRSMIRALDSGIIGMGMGGGVATVSQFGSDKTAARNRAETMLQDFETRRKLYAYATKISELSIERDKIEDPEARSVIESQIKKLQQDLFLTKNKQSRILNNMTEGELANQFDNINELQKIESDMEVLLSQKLGRSSSMRQLKIKQKNLKNKQEDIYKNVTERTEQNDIKISEELAKEMGRSVKTYTQDEINKLFPENNDKNTTGFVDPKTGNFIVNTTVTNSTGNINTASHEVLHGIIKRAVGTNPELMEEFKKVLESKGQLEAVTKRINAVDGKGKRLYSDDYLKTHPDEWMTQFSNAIRDGEITFDEGLMFKIGKALNPVLEVLGFPVNEGAGFKNGKAVYEFLRTYESSIKSGEVNKQLEDIVKKLPKQDSSTIENDEAPSSKESEELESIYETKGTDGTFEILEGPVVGNIVKKILNKYENVPGFDKQLLTDAIKTGKGGIFELINGDGNKNKGYDGYVKKQKAAGKPVAPLAGYINSSFGTGPKSFKKYINIAKEILGEEFTIDIDQASGVAAVETAEDTILAKEDKPKSKATKASKLLSKENLNKAVEAISKVFPNIPTKNLTFKKLGNLIPDIIADQIGIPVKKITNPAANLSKSEATKIQQFITKNIDVIKRILPEGAVLTAATEKLIGTSTGVSKALLKPFYTKSDRLTRGAGLSPYTKNKNITTDQIFKAAGIVDGKKSTDFSPRSPEAQVLKAIANLSGKLISGEIARQQPGISKETKQDIGAGKAETMFSKEVEQLIDDNEFDTGQKNIDKLLEKYIKEKSFDLNSKSGIDDFFNAVEDILIPLFPEGFISKTILRPSNRIFSKKNRVKNDEYYTKRRDELFLTKKQRQEKGLKPLKYGKEWSGAGKGFKQRVYEAVFGNTPKEINQSNKQGKIKKFNDQNLSMHRQMWDRINKSIKSDPNNARVVANFMKMVGSLKTHPHRLGAEMVAWDKNPLGDGKKLYEWEHAMPATSAYLYLMDAALSGANFNNAYNAITANYKLIALDKNSDNKLKAAKLTTSMPKGWRVLSNFWWQRYFNTEVGAIDGGINPDLLEFTDGLTASTKFNIDTNGNPITKELVKSKKVAAKFNNNMLPRSERVLSKEITNQEVLDKMAEVDETSKENELVANREAELSEEFNKIIEGSTGIGKDKKYSRVKAEVVGASKGRFDFFIPPSAEDFVGLLYKTLGKGKVGNDQMAWYKAHLLNPYAKAMDNISRARVALMNDFKALKKDLKIVPKTLKKKLPEENFTQEQAVRVYIWDKQGMTIPGIAGTDIKSLVDFIQNNNELVAFADQLIAMQKGDQYASPDEGWLAGNITTDLIQGINTTTRSKYLEVWQQNADEIFTEANLNKLEAAYGKNYRVALENILNRMKTGKNRSFGGDTLTGRVTDWLTNSIGAIMFFNTRSAVLQTISAINFVNFSDNNIFKAGKAFANQKQFWSDFKTLFNSDFLVERRDGLRLNVNEADIADMAKKGGVKGVISELLRLGFLPTQLADSFAIASGGSTFYRNRIKALEKQGMSKKEAETQAFQDFRETAEESQQSSRPDRISQQQAGPLGRIILAFANTPAQYARLMKKAASDLKNGRGDAKSNVSKIIYYGVAQNLIFNALQQALFALAFGDEEEDDKEEKRYINVANGMADSILRGAGLGGAVFSVLKNTALRLSQESEKKSPKYQDVLVKEVAQLSPPISSKLGKLRAAGRSYSWNRKEMMEKGWSIDNPAYLAAGQVIAATTNIPLDRAIKKIDNIRNASNSDLEAWQRVASAAGWSAWELGIQKPKSSNNSTTTTRQIRKGTIKKRTLK